MFGIGKKKEEIKKPVNNNQKIITNQKPIQKTGNNSSNSVNKSNNKSANKVDNKKPITKNVKSTKSSIQKQPKQPVRDKNGNIKMSRLQFYDNILSSMESEKIILPSNKILGSDELALEWGRLISANNISMFYVVESYDRWVPQEMYVLLRNAALEGVYNVKINYYMNMTPHFIDWNSPKMRQYVKVNQRRVESDTVDRDNVFTKRENHVETELLKSKVETIDYFYNSDLDNHRSIFRTSMFIQIVGERNDLASLNKAIMQFNKACVSCHIKATKITVDIFDWMRCWLPTSFRTESVINKRTPIQVMTDDTISALHGSMQGKIGTKGIPLGLDLYSCLPVLHVFREDPGKAENVLISAQTGGGKTVFVKNMMIWLLAYGFKFCILDYEGDEYSNMANLLNMEKPGSAIIIDMKAGNGNYFDPLRISSLPTDSEEDLSAKAEAIQFTLAMFNIIFKGEMSMLEEDILSTVITKVYKEVGVTDNPKTWHRSKSLRIQMIYDKLKIMYEQRKPFIDASGDDRKQRAAGDLLLRLKRFFVPGETDYGTFSNPLNVEDLWGSTMVIFSFGNKGRDNVGADSTKLALKQLCVSKVSNEISNYNKYVTNKYTVKIWEEVQRFIDVKGAGEIMKNCITGGRKRGDIAFIVTNNLAELLDIDSANNTPEKVSFLKALKSNLQGLCIGYIPDEDTIDKFCEIYNMELFKEDLKTIAQQTGMAMKGNTKGENPWSSSFLVKFTTKTPIETVVKATVHESLFTNHLFDNGIMDKNTILNTYGG